MLGTVSSPPRTLGSLGRKEAMIFLAGKIGVGSTVQYRLPGSERILSGTVKALHSRNLEVAEVGGKRVRYIDPRAVIVE